MKQTLPPSARRIVCAGPIALLFNFSLIAAGTCLLTSSAGAATLLSSPAMTGSFGGASPAAGFADTGGGRVGGALQPLGSVSVTSQPAVTPAAVVQSRNVSTEEPAQRSSTRTYRRQQTETPRRRHVEEEPSEPVRPRQAPTATVEHQAAPSEPRVVSDGKEAKTQVLATTAQNPWHAEIGVGYYTDYQSFRGVNILDVVTPEHGAGSGVIFSSFKLGYARQHDSLTFGFNYWQGLDRVYAKGPIYDVPPNSTRRDNEKFRLPSRDRYAEYNLNATYTRNFWEDKLSASVGYNHFQFSNGNFWKSGDDAIAYANEIMFGLSYNALPYITPSLNYAIDFDGFKGSYIELRVDGAYDLYQRGDFAIRLRPYVAVSGDFDYNGADNGWNAFEVGLNVPVRLNNIFTLTFSSNYVLPLSESEGEPRASDGLWGGIKLTADWGGPGPERNLPISGKTKDAKIVIPEPGDLKWEVSVGGGWREIRYSFDHRGADAYPVGRLFEERARNSDRGFATPGARKVYDDGIVDARGAAATGLAPFSIDDGDSQIIGTRGNNAQVRFSSSDYGYNREGKSFSSVYEDKDSVLSPYINFDRELWRKGSWSLRGGLLYAYTGTNGDSGYRLARLDTVFEQKSTIGYVYTFDNQNAASQNAPFAPTLQNVIVDANTYAGLNGVSPFGLRPKSDITGTDRQIVSVGTFVRSSVDIDAHDLALPFSFRYDFGNRIHAELTVAPTVTLANAELKTEVESRSFSDFGREQTQIRGKVQPLPVVSGFGVQGAGGGGSLQAIQASAPAQQQQQVAQKTAQKAAGKGSTPENPRYPGYLLAKNTYGDSVNDLLFGISTGVSIILDLNQEQTFFAELYGKYHWVQDFVLDDGFGKSNIDLSSFQVGVGLGYRF